ncbi:LOW QUALITY PROTEIN: uncharacterized protein si:ch211-137a8.2, partial [Scomber scombrus]|uniref:LOW QUALITY PROTEIN: uncharacterized protein si:ch211-137a8.2 n=1 Tax=Scomber scombrus TaxID=13677 RepID=UPI002DD94464
RLRCEAGSRLVQLDSLTQRNRTLTRLFQGAMQARVLASARKCGARWDEVNAKLETITAQLKSGRGLRRSREDLAVWLADLDVRLTEVEHLTGSTCEKLRRLQTRTRVNALLQRGEELIQRSEPTDVQHVESRLLELLRCCSHVYNNIARTHTRLLSMRLVFEDDWILSQATDSGCPSETLLEEEGALDKPTPPSPSSPSHEHLGLEWDPSVDIGRSVSRDDADSSYFSASTGRKFTVISELLQHRFNMMFTGWQQTLSMAVFVTRDGLKRRSYLSSLGSLSDISNDINNQEADLRREEWRDPALLSPVASEDNRTELLEDQWVTSTPDGQKSEPVSFDCWRVRAWLGVQSVFLQIDGLPAHYLDESRLAEPNQLHLRVVDSRCNHDDTQKPFLGGSFSPSRDLKAAPDWMWHRHQSHLQDEEEPSCCEDAERLLSEQSVVTPNSRTPSSLLSPALLYLLLAAALALLACLIWGFLEPPCHRSNRMHRTLHLALRYVNGPPPT